MANAKFSPAIPTTLQKAVLSRLSRVHLDVQALRWLADHLDGNEIGNGVHHAHTLVRCATERVCEQIDECRQMLGDEPLGLDVWDSDAVSAGDDTDA